MGLFRTRPIVAAEVALHAPARAAVRLDPAAGGEGGDAAGLPVLMGVGMAAVIGHEVPETRRAGMWECLVEAASGIAGLPVGQDPVRLVHLGPLGIPDHLEVIPWGGAGRGRVAAEVVAGGAGARVPRITDRPAFAGPSAEIATLALVCHVAAAAGPGDRLALALGLEGVIAWYREAHPMSPPRDALRFALVHAADRMQEAGRAIPPGLA